VSCQVHGSVVSGLEVPVKQEHVAMLQRALLPLHRPARTTDRWRVHLPRRSSTQEFHSELPVSISR
jgi:hypothetical protein